MAASASMQSILASSVVYGGAGNKNALVKVSHSVPAKYAPTRYPNMRVHSIAKNGEEEQPSKAPAKASAIPPPPPPPTPFTKRNPKVRTKFSYVFAFSGLAPERINGRLAMVRFVLALAVELSKGQDVLAQISDGGVSLFLGTGILLSVASVIPLFKGVSVESKSDGIMTSNAELWNGRLAMLGLVALVFTEFVKGGTLV